MKMNFSLKNSIITKLTVLILAAVFLPLIISSIITYKNAVERQKDYYIKSDLKSLIQHGENIYNFFDQFNSLSNSLILDKTFTQNLSVPSNDTKTALENEDRLRYLLLSNPSIQGLNLYIENADTLYSIPRFMNSIIIQDSNVRESYWYKKTSEEVEKGTGSIGLITDYKSYTFLPQIEKKGPAYTFNRIYRGIDNKKSAVLSLEISSETFSGLCKAAVQQDETILLQMQDGTVLYSNQDRSEGFKETEDDSGYFVTEVDQVENLVLFANSYEGLKIYKLIPMSVLADKAMEAVMPNVLTWLILTAAIITIVVPFIVVVITRPLSQITNKISSMKNGENFPRIEVKGKDEIAILAGKYNEMSENLERLILSEYKAVVSAKNAQIVALQAQINPHFTGNMLQSIGNTVINDHPLEAYTMLTSLSELIRYGYRADLEKVPLYEEVEYIERYLFLQKNRFEERLNFETKIDHSAAKALMPKLIFQPIVENSIEHGFTDRQQTMHIQIQAYVENDKVILEIEDDGRGMERARLEEIQEWLSNEGDLTALSEHIGIRNVFMRLRLIWGVDVSVAVSSKQGEGTKFVISFPFRTKGE